MKKKLSRRVTESILATFILITLVYLAAGIPLVMRWVDETIDHTCFMLVTLVGRDQDHLANELFERRLRAIELRLADLSRVDQVLSIALYDEKGGLVHVASNNGNDRIMSDTPKSIVPPRVLGEKGYVYKRDGGVLNFTYPIRAVGETLGWLSIDYDLSKFRRQLIIVYTFTGGMLLMTLLCMLTLLRMRLNRSVVAPLHHLGESMRQAEGELPVPLSLPERADREVAEVIAAFNDMTNRLRASYRELDAKNILLEESLAETARNAEALRISESKFRGIVNQAPVGIMLFGNDGVVTKANQYFAKMMGAPTPEHIVGIDMLHQINSEKVRECVRETLEKGDSSYLGPYHSISGDKDVYLKVRLRRLTEDLLMGAFEDITKQIDVQKELEVLNRDLEGTIEERTRDLREHAEALEEANRRLMELDRLKSVFLSSVSHELRTPLTSVLGFAKVTRKNFLKYFNTVVSENPDLRKRANTIDDNLAIITREGERLARLVNDVLDLTRIESGRMPWNDRAVVLEELLGEAVLASEGDFHEKDVTLCLEVEAGLPDLFLDPDKLVQVMRNLLHNAAKFTTHGTVTVSAGIEAHEPGFVLVRVSDTGMGIEPGHLNAVFERFHQTVQSEDGFKTAGSGLGLAICRQIVEHYGGEIWAESEMGKGTTFAFKLPID